MQVDSLLWRGDRSAPLARTSPPALTTPTRGKNQVEPTRQAAVVKQRNIANFSSCKLVDRIEWPRRVGRAGALMIGPTVNNCRSRNLRILLNNSWASYGANYRRLLHRHKVMRVRREYTPLTLILGEKIDGCRQPDFT